MPRSCKIFSSALKKLSEFILMRSDQGLLRNLFTSSSWQSISLLCNRCKDRACILKVHQVSIRSVTPIRQNQFAKKKQSGLMEK